MLAEEGLTFDRSDYVQRFMGLSADAYHAAIDVEAQARLGRTVSAVIRQSERLRAVMVAKMTEVAGATDAVAALQLPKAIASSGSMDGLHRKLTRTGLWQHFAPHVYGVDHVQNAKPAPDLFLHAAAALGVAPGDCLVIEDSVNGVVAARAAGMRVWGFLGGGHADDALGVRLTEAGAERVLHDWPETSALLADLTGKINAAPQ
jgi:beta-phosphoglucomutase-like phosphatase (HAD superfamily)